MKSASPTEADLYSGRAVFMFAYDLAYDMLPFDQETLLGYPLREYCIGPSKRNPKRLLFYRPQWIELPPETRLLQGRSVEVTSSVKVFRIGAISVQVSVPFEHLTLESLVDYHNLQFEQGSAADMARDVGNQVLDALKPFCIRPVEALGESEAYTIFLLDALSQTDSSLSSEAWLAANRQTVAAMLTEEPDASSLSAQEAEESTQGYLSYYAHDLVVADWDAALIAADQETSDDMLHIMEVANVQLLELNVIDHMLDTSLDNAYRDLQRKRIGNRRKIHQNLRELRVDMARYRDELLNVTKFFGDWHLARLYQSVSDRFHLQDWYRMINEKLSTLAELYQLLHQDSQDFWMVIMEATIVLLFILDLVLLFVGL